MLSLLNTSYRNYFVPKEVEMLLPPRAVQRVQKAQLVGSRITCDPPVLDTDQDILVLATSKRFQHAMIDDGWKLHRGDSTYHYARGTDTVHFWSYRKCDLNVIHTKYDAFYNKFMLATRTAKRMNLMHKVDRQTLFQAILYGNG